MYKEASYNLAVGLALRQLHDERQVPREALAKALEISELAVTRIENGAERMTAGELILMLEMFDVTFEDFMDRVRRHLAAADAEIAR